MYLRCTDEQRVGQLFYRHGKEEPVIESEPARQTMIQSVRSPVGRGRTVSYRGQGGGGTTPGAIVLIGGCPTDRDEPEQLHRHALSLARASRRVTIVGAAGNDRGYVADLVRHFKHLGAEAVDAGLYVRTDAEMPDPLTRLARADLIYFAGGAPRQLVEALRDTSAWECIVRAWQGGAVLVGSSAGCDALGAVVVSSTAGPAGRRGFGILPDTVLAGHFREWQRGSHLAATLTVHPTCVGVGIDEYTAAVLRPGMTAMQVTGQGSVSLWINGERSQQAGAGELVSMPNNCWTRLWPIPA
jgi:cyanophycinase